VDKKKKILIVEDEAFLREIYVDALIPEGFQVDSAVDGEEAYTKIKQGGYDLILLDIILPKLNAFQLLDKLNLDQEYDRSKNKIIIFLTNLDNDNDIKRALALGGEGYLVKSQLTPGDLIHEVKMYLEKKENSKNDSSNPSSPIPPTVV